MQETTPAWFLALLVLLLPSQRTTGHLALPLKTPCALGKFSSFTPKKLRKALWFLRGKWLGRLAKRRGSVSESVAQTPRLHLPVRQLAEHLVEVHGSAGRQLQPGPVKLARWGLFVLVVLWVLWVLWVLLVVLVGFVGS